MSSEAGKTTSEGGISPLAIPEKTQAQVDVGVRLSKALGAGACHLLLLAAWLTASSLTAACEKVHAPSRESHAVDLVRVLLSALESYRSAYPEQGYPDALAELGPGPAGSRSNLKAANLIDATLAGGEKNGYRFLYIPGPPDPNGAISSFAITARPLHYEGPGTPSFFTNQVAVIRQTTGDRSATDADPPVQ